eukprot:Nk52_evm65s210 gene=Nk52_evmTU65s210
MTSRFVGEIGNTPLVDLSTLSANPNVKIYGKCEFMNPGLSIKDRIAKHILDVAEKKGDLKPGGTVVAASSGNTAAAISMLCAMRGYKAIVITNEKCSKEKVDTLYAYGAEVIVVPSGVPADHPEHYQNVEKRLCEENPSFYGVNQYDNPLNPEAYYLSLGPEIWEQTNGEVTHLVAAGSTGGTISGTSRFLKEKKESLKSICPDPYGSIFYDYWKDGKIVKPKSFLVEGVGKDSIPKAMDFSLIDDMPRISDKEAFDMCHRMAESEGMVVGGSGGLNVACAVKMSAELKEPSVIVAILPDSGVKYLTKIYNQNWLQMHEHMLK